MPVLYTSGSDTQVNSTSANSQSNPAICILADGTYVVAFDTLDGDNYGVAFRQFTADGAPLSSYDVLLNSYGTSYQSSAALSALPGGGFVATWISDGQDGSLYGIYGRVVFPNGAYGPEFRVNTYTSNYQLTPDVSALSDGGFVVTWASYSQDGDSYGVYAQRYNSNGAAVGGEFRVSSTVVGEQSQPTVAGLENGGFVVAWQSYLQDGSFGGIYAQRYDAAGIAQGAEFRVNSFTTNHQGSPEITALDGGGFVVVWTSVGQDGSAAGIFGQRYDAAGIAVGGEFQVNTTTASYQDLAHVTPTADGGFIVTFYSYSGLIDTYDVFAQRFAADGSRDGGEFRLNSYTSGTQYDAVIAATADGGFVTAWYDSGLDGSGGGIFSRIYRVSEEGYGTVGTDQIVGTSSGDILSGDSGNDALLGFGGDDVFEGGLGADQIVGGAGWDEATFEFASSGVAINLQTGGGTAGEATGDTFSSVEQFTLSRFDDRFVGASGSQTVSGGGGNDQIAGGGGDDYLEGGTGDDTLEGGVGADFLFGDAGYDIASYARETAAVTINLVTEANGGAAAGDEFASIEEFDLSRFSDVFTGSAGADRVLGLAGNDVLNGGAGDDYLSGGNDNDILAGGTGADMLIGGTGTDRASYQAAGSAVTINRQTGVSTGEAAGDQFVSIEQFWLTGFDDTFVGNASGDAVYSGNGNDNLSGGAGGDSLNGQGGSDLLDGGTGTDSMSGGTGNDTFIVDDVGDVVQEGASEGLDLVKSAVTYTLSLNVENLDLVGGAAIDGNGNNLNNVINGNAAANQIDGKTGADTMRGGLGNDTYLVDNAGDLVSEDAGAGADHVKSAVSYTLTANVENLTLLGAAAINATGNVLANRLAGNTAANILDGGAGNDILIGGDGADLFVFSTALAGNLDTVSDFVTGDDTFRLSRSVFSAITADGTIAASAFFVGTAAHDADDRIIYDSATGNIFYDADGNGAGGAQLFARVTPELELTNADFSAYSGVSASIAKSASAIVAADPGEDTLFAGVLHSFAGPQSELGMRDPSYFFLA